MWLVLCSAFDLSALWAYRGLVSRGLAPLQLVTAEVLASSLRWEHRVGREGTGVAVALADGREIRSGSVRGVLNRLVSVPPQPLQGAAEGDRAYAAQELAALFMSWLYALPRPLLNEPTPQGLSGAWRHVSEWLLLAAEAGLPTPEYEYSSEDEEGWARPSLAVPGAPVKTVIVVDGRTAGARLPDEIAQGCLRLAGLSDTALLGIDFLQEPGGEWTFAGATPQPSLELGGERLLDLLADALRRPRGEA